MCMQSKNNLIFYGFHTSTIYPIKLHTKETQNEQKQASEHALVCAIIIYI